MGRTPSGRRLLTGGVAATILAGIGAYAWVHFAGVSSGSRPVAKGPPRPKDSYPLCTPENRAEYEDACKVILSSPYNAEADQALAQLEAMGVDGLTDLSPEQKEELKGQYKGMRAAIEKSKARSGTKPGGSSSKKEEAAGDDH